MNDPIANDNRTTDHQYKGEGDKKEDLRLRELHQRGNSPLISEINLRSTTRDMV